MKVKVEIISTEIPTKEIIDCAKTELAEENGIRKHFVKVDHPQELLERCIRKTFAWTMNEVYTKSIFHENPKKYG